MRKNHITHFITFLAFLLSVLSIHFIQGQTVSKFFFPDIPGYRTLKCDFHMHTVISDGTVVPSFRVTEASQDGLDVIAITDHIDRLPNIVIDENGIAGLYKDAYALAKKLHIILIPGAELTKKMPVGHYNLLFINHFGSIKDGNYLDVLENARRQSAYITWNHPGWKHIFIIPVWHHVQTELLKKGLINGIEIVNYKSHYPLTQGWARKKKLTIFACSDIHDSTKKRFRSKEHPHRPITLVFSKDTTLTDIKNALIAGRTLAFNAGQLYGSDTLLRSLFLASVKAEVTIPGQITTHGREEMIVRFKNNSCMNYELILKRPHKGIKAPKKIVIKPGSVTEVKMYKKQCSTGDDIKIILNFKVKNMYHSYLKNIRVNIPLICPSNP